jgi:nicotinamide riboside transporter PnuC
VRTSRASTVALLAYAAASAFGFARGAIDDGIVSIAAGQLVVVLAATALVARGNRFVWAVLVAADVVALIAWSLAGETVEALVAGFRLLILLSSPVRQVAGVGRFEGRRGPNVSTRGTG